jgi:hypothetical protein
MALALPQGLAVGNGEPVDNRTLFETVGDALSGVAASRRYDGLQVRIKDSDGEGNPRFYVFHQTGTPALNPANWELILDPAVGVGGGGAGSDLIFEEIT